jgi:superfamily I DNA/RNA helicase
MGRGVKMFPDAAARCAALAAVDRSLLVEARAGSGKTALMAGRVAVLFANGVEPKRVAAVTFTEFAASELLQRITRLAHLHYHSRLRAEAAQALSRRSRYGPRRGNHRSGRSGPRL